MRNLAMIAVLLFAPASRGQEGKFTTLYYGVKACLPCHEKGTQTIFTSRLTEYRTWSTHDKHKDAARVLKNERSQQIARLMNLPADLTNEPRCANCHGVYIDPAKEKTLIHEDTFQGEDRLASGVSCVACHGPVAEWVNEHVLPLPKKKWSARSREEKKTQFGLRDLWNPVERSELCVSCHVGNAAEGKYVTHEMYAAGHPPLPGIEIATFSEAMPAHWETLAQKAARARSLPADAKNGREFLKTAYGIDADNLEMEQTRLSVTASLVTARASLQDLSGHIESRGAWPELAFYDCYACHHDLKTKSWRLERGYLGKPGRPTPRAWPFALTPESLANPLAQWERLFREIPFGEQNEVFSAARKLEGLLSDDLKSLSKIRFDRPKSQQIALALSRRAQSQLFDFDSARQFAWSLRTIAIELNDGFASPGPPLLKPPFAEPFGELEKMLQLRLPEGQVEIVPTMLDNVLGRIADYDPHRFRKLMQSVERAIVEHK